MTCCSFQESYHFRINKDTLHDHNKTPKHLSSIIAAREKGAQEVEMAQMQISLKDMWGRKLEI
jgi:hypothetical protein